MSGSSKGSLLGGVLGAGIGLGIVASMTNPAGWAYAAYVGFTLGYGVGSMIDPVDSNSDIGKPEDGVTINDTMKGLEVSDVLGLTHIGGNVLWYGDRDKDKVKKDDQKYYEYYLTWWLGICKGPVDVIHAVYKNGDLVWQGYETLEANPSGSVTLELGEGTTDVVTLSKTKTLTFPAYHWYADTEGGLHVKVMGRPLHLYDNAGKTIVAVTGTCGGSAGTMDSYTETTEDYGNQERNITRIYFDTWPGDCSYRVDLSGPGPGQDILTLTVNYEEEYYETYAKGEEIGDMIFYFGTDDQVDIGSGDDRPTMNMRGLCWASFENCNLGTYPTAPAMSFVIGKYPTFAAFDNPNSRVNNINYNAAHAIYYMLTVPGGMPSSFIDTDALDTLADTTFSEGLGVSFRISGTTKVFSYVESILQHIDAVSTFRPDSNGDPKFYFKLLRGDESIDSLPVVSRDNMTEQPTLIRRSWIETYNEIKAKHFEVVGDVFGLNWIMTCMDIGAGTAQVNGYSFDLLTWTEGGFASGYTHYPRGLAFIDDLGMYVSVGDGTGSIQTSFEGTSWSYRYHNILGQLTSTKVDTFYSVGGGGGSGKIMVGGADGTHNCGLGISSTGSSWTDLTSNLPTPTGQIWTVLYDTEHSLWIIGSVGNYNRARILTSIDDGVTWVSRYSEGTGVWNGINDGVYYDGTTVLVGNQGKTWYSTNGTTWSESYCGYNVILTSVAYKAGTWVAVGYSGATPYTFTSTNGTSWTLLTQPSGMSVMKDVFSDGILFVAVGYDAQIWKSADGLTWNEIDHGMYGDTYDFGRIVKRTE